MKKVSLIVPVYNSEKYLRKCLDSLVNQTLKDIEIILINDGSKDTSEEIIKEFNDIICGAVYTAHCKCCEQTVQQAKSRA